MFVLPYSYAKTFFHSHEIITEMKKVALIGSFQKALNYQRVLEIIQAFRAAGLTVVSPTGTAVTSNRDGFVVFESDDFKQSNEKIQQDTLNNIFTAEAVYVVDVAGYLGWTTCYEIGRLIERQIPLYFLEHPTDLPLCITEDLIVSPEDFIYKVLHQRLEIISCECSHCVNFLKCTGKYNEL